MVFSSSSFLFVFLPIFLLCYFASPARFRNLILFIFSLIFYWLGSGYYLILMCFSIGFNYACTKLLCDTSFAYRKATLIFSVAVNLGALLYYKYAGFLVTELYSLFPFIKPEDCSYFSNIILPIGISFYTFQGMSATIDAYRGEYEKSPTLIEFGMYLSAFPQLIAGPIVRYLDIKDQVRHRDVTTDLIYRGALRFIYGLAKKVLLADTFARIADEAFNLPEQSLGFLTSWLGVISYAFQIYFDFSAYSDMAIGIGLCIGFHFPENFNNPYRAKSITDFWRRWHISLSTWFRDYLYIPLGGNRKGPVRTIINLFIVFTLCGFWHGASYNFILWGLYHGFLLSYERLRFKGEVRSSLFAQIKTFFLVLVGWTIFRCEDLQSLKIFLKKMFLLSDIGAVDSKISYILTPDIITLCLFGIIIVCISGRPFLNSLKRNTFLEGALVTVLLLLSAASLVSSDFHPFIYFRF